MGSIRMARPTRRKRSTVAQFRERIPLDVLSAVRGRMLRVPIGSETVSKRISNTATHIGLSLGTRDKAEAVMRNAVVSIYLSKVYEALRSAEAPIALPHQGQVAIGGEAYRAWATEGMGERVRNALLAEHGNDLAIEVASGEPGVWHSPLKQAETATANAGPLVDKLLMSEGVSINAPSREMAIHEAERALGDAFAKQARNAIGDYSPDLAAVRFPPLTGLGVRNETAPGERLTLDALFKRWRNSPEQKKRISQATVRGYDRVFRALGEYLAEMRSCKPAEIACHSITRAEVRAYAQRRRGEVSARTVNDADLAALKSIFGWAVDGELLTDNPAKDVRLKPDHKGKRRRRPDAGFTDAEAVAILRHARNHKPHGREEQKMTAAKRWVPWLQAYTGTRVGEMAQLRKEDVLQHEGRWALRVTPEAGTVKTGDTWRIPLHSHLIELGFLDFVKQAPSGHLFLTPNPKAYSADAPETRIKDPRGILGPLRALANRMAEFTREVVAREDVAPTHGWRHRFKAQGRNPALGIQQSVLDAIQDHAPRTEGEAYGGGDLFDAMVVAIDKLPRYEVET